MSGIDPLEYKVKFVKIKLSAFLIECNVLFLVIDHIKCVLKEIFLD